MAENEDKNQGATKPTQQVKVDESSEPKYIEEARQAFFDKKPKPGFVYRFGAGGKLHVRRVSDKRSRE